MKMIFRKFKDIKFKIILFITVSLQLLNLSCGKKGGPLPPISNIPMPVESIKLKQMGKYLVLQWDYVPKYDDNRPLKNFNFRIYKNEELIKPKVYKVNYTYWFYFPIENFRKEYCFYIIVETRKEKSEPSRYNCLIPNSQIPSTPEIEKIVLREDGLELNWIAKGDKINIYRSEDKYIIPTPVYKVKNTSRFLDKNLIFNHRYCYFLTVDKGNIESSPSSIMCKRFVDIFPPEPPLDFRLIKKENDYYLFWTDSPSKDVIGYIIYKNGKPLFNTPIKTYFFIDKSYNEGDKYTIVAIDKAGNRSKPISIK